jgi:hypothetical protein
LAALPSGNDTLQTNDTVRVLRAGDPERFEYDLDGNLTPDGLWTYGY